MLPQRGFAMNVQKILEPWLARFLASAEVRQTRRRWYGLRRRMAGDGHVLEVFLKVSDPYSYLLAAALPDLHRRFAVDVRCHLVQRLPDNMTPEPELWQRNAVADCTVLAKLYGIPFQARDPFPDARAVTALERELVALLRAGEDPLPLLAPRMNALWRGEYDAGEPGSRVVEDELAIREYFRASQNLLARLGHYNSAMVYYDGEWYWGLDRLDHLERRLVAEGLGRWPGTQVRYDRQSRDFCLNAEARQLPETTRDRPLEMFFSIRSPYSYLGLEKAAQFCHHYGLNLVVRPVLPMVMRGLKVPRAKVLYIFLDAKREADKAGIPFGFVADPLGAGVEACYQLYSYARDEGRGLEYLLSVARGVYAEGVDIADPGGLRKLAERAGLDWSEARRQLGNTVWTEWAQANLEALYGLGLWGVPAFRFGDVVAWGQDRLWIIEQTVLAGISREASTPTEYQGVIC